MKVNYPSAFKDQGVWRYKVSSVICFKGFASGVEGGPFWKFHNQNNILCARVKRVKGTNNWVKLTILLAVITMKLISYRNTLKYDIVRISTGGLRFLLVNIIHTI